ncbi:MAG: TetR/AcrR family transcriptional regulator, partial [Acutalibacteraceae bacterium]
MPKSEYKSSIRSKTLIRNALIQLLTEKPLEKITVTDIVKRADINRGTFYAHYADINELLKSVGDEIISLLYEALSEVDYADLLQSPLPALFKISSFLEKDIEYFRLMFARVSAVPFIEKLQTAFIEFMENNTAINSEIRESDEFKN